MPSLNCIDPNKAKVVDLLLSLARAIYVSGSLGLGFIILFGFMGLIIATGSRSFVSIFPWLGLALGFALCGLGSYLFAGGKIYARTAQNTASRFGSPSKKGLRGYFFFGIS